MGQRQEPPRSLSNSDEEGQRHATQGALSSAFQENAAGIYRFVYAKVGNREGAEDITGQVFLKATRWLAADRSADSIRAWLFATARSAISDYWCEQSRVQSVDIDEGTLLFCGRDGSEELRRTHARVLRILAALPQREREVLRLRFLHGYNAEEIGRVLQISVGNVRVLQLRALRRAARLTEHDLKRGDPSSTNEKGD